MTVHVTQWCRVCFLTLFLFLSAVWIREILSPQHKGVIIKQSKIKLSRRNYRALSNDPESCDRWHLNTFITHTQNNNRNVPGNDVMSASQRHVCVLKHPAKKTLKRFGVSLKYYCGGHGVSCDLILHTGHTEVLILETPFRKYPIIIEIVTISTVLLCYYQYNLTNQSQEFRVLLEMIIHEIRNGYFKGCISNHWIQPKDF